MMPAGAQAPSWLHDGIVTPRHRQLRLIGHLPGLALVVGHAVPGEQSVALTFDDGPEPEATPELLGVLADHGVPATFFVLVERAQAHGALLTDVVGGGHVVGLHGDVHESLSRAPVRVAAARLRNARARLEDAVGRSVSLYRPPFGTTSVRLLRAAAVAGLTVVMWSHDPRDWDVESSYDLAGRIRRCLEPGAVVLLHDGTPTGRPARFDTPSALRSVLETDDDHPPFRVLRPPEG